MKCNKICILIHSDLQNTRRLLGKQPALIFWVASISYINFVLQHKNFCHSPQSSSRIPDVEATCAACVLASPSKPSRNYFFKFSTVGQFRILATFLKKTPNFHNVIHIAFFLHPMQYSTHFPYTPYSILIIFLTRHTVFYSFSLDTVHYSKYFLYTPYNILFIFLTPHKINNIDNQLDATITVY